MVYLLLLVQLTHGQAQDLTDDERAFFETKIRPVLIEHCYKCHGDERKIRGGLNLTDAASLRNGGDSGVVVHPGMPDESLLITAITYEDEDLQMPPPGKLSDTVIQDFRHWVATGCPDPRTASGDKPGAGEVAGTYEAILKDHWSYQHISSVDPPNPTDHHWCRNPVDRFILTRLEEEGLEPNPRADRWTLIRRATYNLTGLPPTPEEIHAFLADEEPGAWERVIDRLLASPQYGVRWGRHWLDVARYADSNGLDENTAFANSWKYRDYVVDSFNADKPYDRFLTEQLAGDLLPEPGDRQDLIDQLVATGFLSLGPKVLAEPDKKKMAIDIVDEQIDVASKAFLGLTVSCARCHDHKFDPIPTTDYYAFAGIFKSTRTMATYKTVAKVLERDLAPQAEIAEMKEYDARVQQNMAALAEQRAAARRTQQDDWASEFGTFLLASTALHRVPSTTRSSTWMYTGPFNAPSTGEAYERNFGPESHRSPGEQVGDAWAWEARANDTDGVVHALPTGTNQVHYLGRVLHVPTPRSLALSLGSDDGIKVFLNGREVLERRVNRGVAADQDTLSVDLEAGDNFLLLKIINTGGNCGWYYRVVSDNADRAQAMELADQRGLDGGVLYRLQVLLDDAAADSIPLLSVWNTLARAGRSGEGNLPASHINGLLESLDGSSHPTAATARSLLREPAPRSLEELSRRYQVLVSLVMENWRTQLAAGSTDKESLSDPGLEAIRIVLLGPGGLLEIAEDDHSSYPPETREALAVLLDRAEELAAVRPDEILAGLVVEDGEITDLAVHIRGSHVNLQETPVPRGFISVTDPVLTPPSIPSEASGRLELARWMTDPDHPLTARVMVNRIWHWHFGTGIVSTPSNLGVRGGQPSHPALLDWLAEAFVSADWSIKNMHRLIMTSGTYQVSSAWNPHAASVDQDNLLRWRWSRKRLEAESIRDAILAAGGMLDQSIGGSLLRTKNFGYVTNDQSKSNETYVSHRRAIYLPVIRNDMYDMFSIFDYPDASQPIGHRPSTTVSHQSLFMLNSPLVIEQAENFAGHLLADVESTDAEKIDAAYLRAFGRPPVAEETSLAIDFLRTASMLISAGPGDSEENRGDRYRTAWNRYCHVLMASSEFIHVH